MTSGYQVYETQEECIYPYWDTTWAAEQGCNSLHSESLAVTLNPTPAQATQWYEPFETRRIYDDRHISGKSRILGFPYFMTPRFVGTYSTRRHLLKRLNSNGGIRRAYQYGHVAKVGGYCTPIPDYYTLEQKWCTWKDVTHLFSGSTYNTNYFKSSDISGAISDITADLAVKSRVSYDLLTEIAEAREIPGLVTGVSRDLFSILKALRGRFSISDLRRMSHLRQIDLLKHPNNAFKRFGDQWMRYRYGIMPLVYSYRDIVKTLHRGKNVTNRCRRVVQPTSYGITLPSPSTSYLWTTYVGEIVLSGTLFQHFDMDSVSQISGIGFNPLVTAWELIPYSFVIDWFVNVGDYIAASTSTSFQQRCQACISQHSNYTKQTWAHYPNQDLTVYSSNRLPSVWYGSTPPSPQPRVISRPEESQLFIEETTSEYMRWLVDVNVAQLRWNPSLNWRRWTDAAAMANNLLKGLIKSLK